jgi:endonuclease/exonuclease/phosphatase family metal-dependent hydrolase
MSVDLRAQIGELHGDTTDSSVRLMSFNLRYGTADDGDNRWELRKHILIDTIRNFTPDILGTQETLQFQADFVRQNLEEYTYVGKSRDPASDNGEQCGIFFRTARFVDLEQGHFWLSEQPDVPGSKSWDSSMPRMSTWVKLYDKAARRALHVFNTHFDHKGATARAESARLIRARINRLSALENVVVTGDFNCDAESEPYRNLLDESVPFALEDTFRALPVNPTESDGTFNGFHGRTEGPRIDWILCNQNFAVTAASIDRTAKEGRFPSDHFPVTAVIQYK